MVVVKLQQIELDPRNKLGEGGYGKVFIGSFEGREVAVKRVESINTDEREETALKHLNHSNVVKLYHVESDESFKYFALELCKASMDQLFLENDDPKRYNGPPLPHNFTVLFQLASGLEYIHSQNFIHRDVKPENVLIHVDSNLKVTMKWADFGLSKSVNERGTFTMSGMKGTKNWMAPELLKKYSDGHNNTGRVRGTIQSDIFAEGLVLGYFFSKGHHPYGPDDLKIPLNIKKDKQVNLKNIQPSYARELIEKMLKNNPEHRITSSEVVLQLEKLRQEMETRLYKLLEESAIDLQAIKALIDEGVDVNCVNQEGLTPFLHLMKGCSTKKNLTETMQLLIANNIDVNSKDNDGWNALHFLCRIYQKQDLIDIIQILIQHGIVTDLTNNEGTNALHLLCQYYKNENITDIIQVLNENGINVNTPDNLGWNVLHISCFYYERENLIDVVRLFIDKGIDINCTTNFKETALQILCRFYRYNKWIKIIRLLVDKGIDVHNKSNQGWNALHSLCKAKHKELDLIDEIRFLIEHGIDVNTTNDDGWNALLILCQNYQNENLIDIVRLFIENGIDVNWKNKGGWNALLCLCRKYFNNNLIDIVRLLIEHGIHVNHKASEGNALHLLCKYYPNENLIDILRLLISNGITVNVVDPRNLLRQNRNQPNNESVIQLLNKHI